MDQYTVEQLGFIHSRKLGSDLIEGNGRITLTHSNSLVSKVPGQTLGVIMQPLQTGKINTCPPTLYCAHFDSFVEKPDEDDFPDFQNRYPIPVNPLPLSKVFLRCVDLDVARKAEKYATELYDALCRNGTIVRMDEVLSVTGMFVEDCIWKFRIVLTEPVCQGHITSGYTKVFVLPASKTSCEGDSNNPPHREFFELDESYLVSSFRPEGDESNCHSEMMEKLEGSSYRTLTRSVVGLAQTSEFRSVLHPTFQQEVEHLVFASASDLTQLGVFSGEWAVASSISGRNSRLVEMRVNHSWSKEQLAATSSLLHNVLAVNDTIGSAMRLRPAPCNVHSQIPTAKSVTVARVVTPIATDRSFQQLVLSSLRDFLRSRALLLKEGDIIAVPILCDLIRLTSPSNSVAENLITPSRHELEQLSRGSLTHPVAMHFQVTQIELEHVSQADDSEVSVAVATGELGCWIDGQTTRVLQSGTEHSRCIRKNLHSTLPKSATELQLLVSAFLQSNAFEYDMKPTILLSGPAGVGKSRITRAVADDLGLHFAEIDCYDLLSEDEVQSQALLSARFERLAQCTPCIVILRHIDCLMLPTQAVSQQESILVEILRSSIEYIHGIWSLTGYPSIVLATCEDETKLSGSLSALFKHQIRFEAPSEHDRYEIIRELLSDTNLSSDVSLRGVSLQTAAFSAVDLLYCIEQAKLLALERATGWEHSLEEDICLSGLVLMQDDIDRALSKSRAAFSQNLSAPKIPSVTWDDVGGLAKIKAEILDTVQLPMEHPELFASGVRKRSGILLYGPPGTGKTMLAKAVATSCSLNFFSVKGPELLNMYIGESESNVRRVFQRARDASPCVIFFDELDSIAPARGNQGDSGGVMDRIVSQLLAELDSISGSSSQANVFVIGATNRPDLLDPALLRPGRFDRMLYLGVPDTHSAQANIIRALTRKFPMDPTLLVEEISLRCPFHYTGADFYALCSDALLNAMSRKAKEVDEAVDSLNSGIVDDQKYVTTQHYLSEMAPASELEFTVELQDFDKALENLVPSVSQAEMEHYRLVQERFGRGLNI